MSSTHISRHVNAARAIVYRALLDPRALATWMVPDGMTSDVHAFDVREGGSFRGCEGEMTPLSTKNKAKRSPDALDERQGVLHRDPRSGYPSFSRLLRQGVRLAHQAAWGRSHSVR